MKTKLRLLAVALIAGGTMFAQSRLSIGNGGGGYRPGSNPPPARQQQYQAPSSGPGYTSVDNYRAPAPESGRNVSTADNWRAPESSGRHEVSRYVESRSDRAFRGYDQDRDRDDERGSTRYENSRHRNDYRGRADSDDFRR